MRRRPPGLVRRVQINRRPSRTCRPRRQRRNKHRARYADTKKPGAIISGAGLLSRLPEGESHICLVHQMVDHVSAAKQHRDTNQNRNKERHDRLLSVVRAGEITLFDITRSANILGSARNRGAIRPRSYRFSVCLAIRHRASARDGGEFIALVGRGAAWPVWRRRKTIIRLGSILSLRSLPAVQQISLCAC
jgi:hypothetical protein